MHKTFYYARVSTREQNLDRQLEAFRALGADERPDQATNNCCDILLLKGVIIANTAKGLATKVRKIPAIYAK